MADPALQALLDPGGTGRGITIVRRHDPSASTASYYVDSGTGRYKWVDVPIANTDAQKNTAIRAALT
jgi:putative lipoic acid-binding regulatory protein